MHKIEPPAAGDFMSAMKSPAPLLRGVMCSLKISPREM